MAFHTGISGETYNIGGKNERTTLEIAEKICEILDRKVPQLSGKKYFNQVKFVEDRKGHDFRYAIDATKIQSQLGWHPQETFNTGIEKTVKWYLSEKLITYSLMAMRSLTIAISFFICCSNINSFG